MKQQTRKEQRILFGKGKNVPSSTKIADSSRQINTIYRTDKFYKKNTKVKSFLNSYYIKDTIARVDEHKNDSIPVKLSKKEARLAYVFRTGLIIPAEFIYSVENEYIVKHDSHRGTTWYNCTLKKLHAKGLYKDKKYI